MAINVLEDDFRAWDNVDDPSTGATRFPEEEKPRWAASRNIDEVSRLKLLREIVKTGTMGWVDGLAIDHLTAGWLMMVYDAVNEKNQAKFIGYDVGVMVDVMYKLEARGAIKLGMGS